MRSPVKSIYDHLIFKNSFNKGYNNKPYDLFLELLEQENLPREEREKIQTRAFNQVLQTLPELSPYRRYFDPSGIDSIQDLKKAPVITKASLKKEVHTFYNKAHCKVRHFTSGSSGDPLTIYNCDHSEAKRRAQWLRMLHWWDIKPSDNNLLIWGKIEHTDPGSLSFRKWLKHKLIGQQLQFNVFDLNKDAILPLYNALTKLRPKYIRGYASAVYQFARLIEKRKLDARDLRLNLAFVTSETLFPEHRRYIEDVLNVNVVDEYGAAEVGLIAYECKEGNKHLCDESLFCFTNNDNELIITDLHNTATPLINYNLGDRVNISDDYCSCGRTSRIITQVEGRTGDRVVRENGETLNYVIFSYALKELDALGYDSAVLKYKVIQDGMHFYFYIEPGPAYSDEVKAVLERKMKKLIGNSIKVKFELVDQIPREKSGKLRYFQRIR